jgi:hypothetical protein
MSNSQRKRERHEVLAAEKAPSSFLDWSRDTITFSREDHRNRIPNPGQYPLVTPGFKGKSECIKHMCARIKFHTCVDSVYTKTQCKSVKREL